MEVNYFIRRSSMKRKNSLLFLIVLWSVLCIYSIPAQAKPKMVKAKAYASKIDELGMVWCPKCGWEKCTLDQSLLDLNFCPKCDTILKYKVTATSTFNGYGFIAYKATVKKNKKTIISFPKKPQATIKGGFVFKEKRIKKINRLSRYRGNGYYKQYGKNKIVVKCKKKTKIMIYYQGYDLTLLTVTVKK